MACVMRVLRLRARAGAFVVYIVAACSMYMSRAAVLRGWIVRGSIYSVSAGSQSVREANEDKWNCRAQDSLSAESESAQALLDIDWRRRKSRNWSKANMTRTKYKVIF